jgi:Na+-translocating ferredoxin:NAD+ oxidoreductase subunit C
VSARAVRLFDGREVLGIELEAESPAPVGSGSPMVGSVRGGLGDRVLRALGAVNTADVGTWIERLRLGGVWADRWTSPDLIGQLHEAMRQPLDTVLCNALDIDPALPLNATLAAECPAELLAGVALLARLVGAERTWLVHDAGADLSAATPDLARAAYVRLVPARGDYPQAHPTLLLHRHAERALRPGELPTRRGVLLLDAAAAVAVGRRFLYGEPMLSVPLAAYDATTRTGRLLVAPLGTSLAELLGATGTPVTGRAFCGGGPMRDLRLPGDAVVSAGSELTVYAMRLRPDDRAEPCLRCGWCLDQCPTHVHPAGILEAAQRDDRGLAQRHGLHACIECGICSYVCPSHLPLLTGIRVFPRAGV